MTKSFLKEAIKDRQDREVDDSFSNYLRGVKNVQSIQEGFGDNDALSKELVLFIEGDSTLNGQVPTTKKTLFRHWKKDSYDSALAERAWMRVVNEAAQEYTFNVGKEPRLWEELFSPDMRKKVAVMLERDFRKDLKTGNINMEELFNE